LEKAIDLVNNPAFKQQGFGEASGTSTVVFFHVLLA
jgi:hypothetical protein